VVGAKEVSGTGQDDSRRYSASVRTPADGNIAAVVWCPRECPEHKSKQTVHVFSHPEYGKPCRELVLHGREWPLRLWRKDGAIGEDFFLSDPISNREFEPYAREKGLAWAPRGAPDDPAAGVSRTMAEGFCTWLAPGFRLPTEAQWTAMIKQREKTTLQDLRVGEVLEWLAGEEGDGVLRGGSARLPESIRAHSDSFRLSGQDPAVAALDFGFRVAIS